MRVEYVLHQTKKWDRNRSVARRPWYNPGKPLVRIYSIRSINLSCNREKLMLTSFLMQSIGPV